MVPDAIQNVVDELLEENLSTLEYYFSVYEELAEDREILHDQIIHKILSKKVYSKGKHVYMLGGAPANGKSTFLNSGIRKYPSGVLKIDPDKVKNELPEYKYMVAIKEMTAASRVHEESSIISREIRRKAIKEGYDVLLDGIANDTLQYRLEDLVELKSYGHTVIIDYVTLNTSLSLQNALVRYRKTGRFVPQEFILEKNRMVAQLIPQLIDNKPFDELYLWDTKGITPV
jgi:predicted ABC-type ATPase